MSLRITVILAFVPSLVLAQDYVLYETQYLTPLPGHSDELSLALERHNREFHAAGPYEAIVRFVVNGPRTGDLFWVMGPSVFSDYDARPTGTLHDNDWTNGVMSHATGGHTEYWVRNDELSYAPPGAEDEDRPLVRVRFFEVSDNAAFQELQRQIVDVLAAGRLQQPRTMYQKQFMSRDGRDWATVTSYRNWSELDEDGVDFQATFIDRHGESAWNQFQDRVSATFISREDEWQEVIPELGGASD